MYRIRTTCLNPACQRVFEVTFPETGPLEGKTPEITFQLIRALGTRHPIAYKPNEETRKASGLKEGDKVNIPEFVECPECHSIFPRWDLGFFVYNANETQNPH